MPVGPEDGCEVGWLDGRAEIDGLVDGTALGTADVEGAADGWEVGTDDRVGPALGRSVGALETEGAALGAANGEAVGAVVVGLWLGLNVGSKGELKTTMAASGCVVVSFQTEVNGYASCQSASSTHSA